jgi:type IV secretion system protein VirD4
VTATKKEKQNKENYLDKMSEKFEKTKLGGFVIRHKLLAGMMYFIGWYLSGVLSQALYKSHLLMRAPDKAENYEVSFGLRSLVQWCTNFPTGLITLIVFMAVISWVIIRFIAPRMRVEVGTKEKERNVIKSDNDTYGTSALGTTEEFENVAQIGKIEDCKGIILGQDKESNDVITLPTAEDMNYKIKKNNWTWDDINNNTRNRNILVIGTPGTMKTRSVIQTSILQAVRRGESIFMTDPKGEGYEKNKSMLESHGYTVRAFNLKDFDNGDSWNMLTSLDDKDDGNAKVFAETVVMNAGGGNGEDSYWNDNAMNFLKACLLLHNTDSFGTLYDFVTGTNLPDFETAFANSPDRVSALRAFKAFNQCSEQVKGQIINGLGIMIDVFQQDNVRNITDSDEIDLTLPAREKCAYFVITSDQHSTYNFLAMLFWVMSFINLIEYIDKHKDENGDPTTLPINMLFDEFSNIGIIPDFTKKISTVRSRNVYLTLIIQNLAQLQNRYPNGAWEEIASCCDTTIFLGANDLTTAEYISERTGIMTTSVKTENNMYERDRIALDRDATSREVTSDGQRMVMTTDEVLRMKNTDSLLLIRGMNPLLCRKYDYTKHPMSKELKKIRIEDYIPRWRQRKINFEKEREKEEKRIAEEQAAEREKRIEKALERQQESTAQADNKTKETTKKTTKQKSDSSVGMSMNDMLLNFAMPADSSNVNEELEEDNEE